ncbi:transposase [Collinsella stercoris]|uniref:transposase n=2 Tax=Collinsella stercoris TaxID=147206 RepID=UPI0039919BED
MEDRFGYGAIVRAMRPEEREEMLGLLLEAVAGEMPAGAEEEPPEPCPRCGCPRTVRRGRDADGAQRRPCRGCGRSFRASTGRVLGTTKLPAATWARHAEAMLAGATLRDAAACVNVNPSFTDSTNAIAPIAPTHPRRFRRRQAPFPASRSGARSFVR